MDLLAMAFVSALLMAVLLETLEILRLKKRVVRLEAETNTKLRDLESDSKALRSEVQAIREDLGRALDRITSIESTLSEVVKHLEHATPSIPVRVSNANNASNAHTSSDLKKRALELKIVNMYRSGIPVKQIVKEVGLSRATIYRILKKYGATSA